MGYDDDDAAIAETPENLRERARFFAYMFLSAGIHVPSSESFRRLRSPEFLDQSIGAFDALREGTPRPKELSLGELDPDPWLCARSFVDFLGNSIATTENEFLRVFGLLLSPACPPYETEYCRQSLSVYRSQQLADIAGFYRAFGLEAERERPDHLVLELEFMAWLILKTLRAETLGDQEAAEVSRRAQARFFEEHLAWWTPAFSLALRHQADSISRDEVASPPKSLYGAYACLLSAFVAAERNYFDIGYQEILQGPAPAENSEPGCEGCSLAPEESWAPAASGV